MGSTGSPVHPALRANPYPEVTDLFCRLPLSTLFYGLEAVHLGDLVRLWVRLGMRCLLEVPQIFKGHQEHTGHYKNAVLYQFYYPCSGQADFRVSNCKEEEKTLPRGPADVSEFLCVTATSTTTLWDFNQIPF